ncbi:flagellar biosynthesis anti-sigma factor FlgM [Novosphingobium sp.]|uniref:flagellar biosynthesis anti-sigma factor FlgM n=1 Tax=Novosphingobium sp. TaxID=1874826 RepID=UPI003B51F5A0
MASLDIGANLPVSAVQSSTVQPAIQPAATPQVAPIPTEATVIAASSAAPQVKTSLSVEAGAVTVDHTRVDEIRKAIQSGNYPLVPAKIGDAMVAAGLMLRKTS